jgi:hypothetical protein
VKTLMMGLAMIGMLLPAPALAQDSAQNCYDGKLPPNNGGFETGDMGVGAAGFRAGFGMSVATNNGYYTASGPWMDVCSDASTPTVCVGGCVGGKIMDMWVSFRTYRGAGSRSCNGDFHTKVALSGSLVPNGKSSQCF